MKSKKKKNHTTDDTAPPKPVTNGYSVLDKCALYIQFIIAVAAIGTLLIVIYQMVVQTRAWITVKGAEIVEIKENKPITAKVVLINSGKSPALDTTIHSNINIYYNPIPDPLPYGNSKGPVAHSVLGPDNTFGSFITKKEDLSSQELQGILDNKAAIYIYGVIEYQDIFNFKRQTKYCMVSRRGSLSLVACENHNAAN
jgi:hypothetical protein